MADNIRPTNLRELEQQHGVLFPKLTDGQLFEIFPQMKQVLVEKIQEEAEIILDAKIRIIDSLIHAKNEPRAAPICEAVAEIILENEFIPHRRTLRKLKWQYESITCSRERKSKTPEEIKNQIGLKEIAEIYELKLIKSGKRFLAICPFHPDKHPSFVIYPDNRFHCFACQINGDIFTFIQLKEGLNFKQALRVLTRYKHGQHN